MKVSFITDEFTQNFDEAISFALDYGLQGIELRSVDNRPIHEFSLDEVSVWKEKLDAAGLKVSNLSGSFNKCDMVPSLMKAELTKLEKLCRIAEILECHTIRGFTFFRTGEQAVPAQEIIPLFVPAEQILRHYGKMLILEADPSVNTTNHAAMAEVLEHLDGSYFGAVYDPGNCLFDPKREHPFPDGYEAIRPYLQHVHIKDAVYKDGEPICLAPGRGLVGYTEVLKRLQADGYSGWLSLEPHYRKNTVLSEEQMRIPSGDEFSKGGKEAMHESVEALFQILKNL